MYDYGVSGNPGIQPAAGRPPLARAELGLPDGRHERPVPADGAPLEPDPAEAQPLERHARNPERPEQVTLPAADDQPAADRAALQPQRKRLEEQPEDDQGPAARAHHGKSAGDAA